MCRSPLVEPLCWRPPFSPHHPDYDENGDELEDIESGEDGDLYDDGSNVHHDHDGFQRLDFYGLSVCHLCSLIPLQRTDTTRARESKVFQEITLPVDLHFFNQLHLVGLFIGLV